MDPDTIQNFVDVARRYCVWAEGPPAEPDEDMHTAQRLLADLHAAVLALPDHFPDVETPDDALTATDWRKISGRFQHLPVLGYWDLFNPLEEEGPVFNTLWDDFSDIWRDLKEALIVYDRGEVDEAVWQWRFNFDIHWGHHLTGAQRAIHAYFSAR